MKLLNWSREPQNSPKLPKTFKTHDKSGKWRKIVAKFESWKQSEKVKQIIIKYNRERKDPQNAIYVDQLYFQRNDRKNEFLTHNALCVRNKYKFQNEKKS